MITGPCRPDDSGEAPGHGENASDGREAGSASGPLLALLPGIARFADPAAPEER
jgi:hypothetical protein